MGERRMMITHEYRVFERLMRDYSSAQMQLVDEYRALLKKRNTLNETTGGLLEACEALDEKRGACIDMGISIFALNRVINKFGEYVKEADNE